MNAPARQSTNIPLSAYVWRAAGISLTVLAVLWVFRPEPLWDEIDVAPHWVYGAALIAIACILLLVQTIRKRLDQKSAIVQDATKRSRENRPTTAATVVAVLAPWVWMFIDHVVTPGLQRMMPAVMERAIYLVIFVLGWYAIARISKWRLSDVISPATRSS